MLLNYGKKYGLIPILPALKEEYQTIPTLLENIKYEDQLVICVDVEIDKLPPWITKQIYKIALISTYLTQMNYGSVLG